MTPRSIPKLPVQGRVEPPSLATFDREWSTERCEQLKRAGDVSVTVVLPALNEEGTVGAVCRTVVDRLMREAHVVDDLIVIDGGSTDLTAVRARAAGARVIALDDVLPDLPVHLGKGESLWRSLAVVGTDLVVWIDADIRNFDPMFVTNLVAPLLTHPELQYVKGYYRRPLQLAETLVPHDGGRVTELLAKPLLAGLFPELTAFHQPLSGEYAARTGAMQDLPFFTGYSVEVGLLIDLLFEVGLGAMGQADLGTRVHRNRPLLDLAPMAHSLSRTILQRAAAYGRISLDAQTQQTMSAEILGAVGELERPPMSLVQADWRYSDLADSMLSS